MSVKRETKQMDVTELELIAIKENYPILYHFLKSYRMGIFDTLEDCLIRATLMQAKTIKDLENRMINILNNK